jgi:soluble lytic murein transglycosylase-like protein
MVRVARVRAFVCAAMVSIVVVVLGATAPGFAATAQSTPKSEPKAAPGTRYVVRPGDSLTAISKRFDVAIPDLRAANKALMASDVVKVGVALQIPAAKAKTGLPQSIRSNPERLRLRRVIRHWSKKNNIPADLVEATLYLESGWNQSRVSSTGAVGVGQIMPGTAVYIKRDLIGPTAGGLSLNETIPEHNIRMSARYLRHLLAVTNGNVDSALQGYYQGFGSIAANGLYPDSKAYSSSIQALRKRFRSDLTGV